MIEDIARVSGQSMDIEGAEKEKLRSVFPQCFNEGKLDIDKLLNLCGEYIDEDFEKYKFEWKGKAECHRIAGKRSTGTLRPCPDESVNFDTTKNMYIEGDNLEVLKLLQTSYYRKVKMMYIDPPYNTGNDFVYEDNFADPMAKYKEVTQQTTKSNHETMGRYHTNWLNMMYPRLRLASNLLRDDGVIFISIDDNEVTNLRKLCDEVFGEENFLAQIIWKKRGGPPNDKILGAIHEYIIAYAKDMQKLTIYRKERTGKQLDRYRNPDNHPKGKWAADNLMANVKGGRYVSSLYYPIINPVTGEEHYPSSNGNWRYNKEKMQQLLDNNEIYFGEDGKGRPKLKRFLCDVQDGVPFATLFDYLPHNNKATAELAEFIGSVNIFDTPKPSDLIKELVKMSSAGDDIVLDFFSGSATTAHAVMQLNAEDGGNRQFIMVQLPEVCDEKSEAFKAGYKNICEIGKERIRRAGTKIAKGDTGFKVFKLDTSNLVKWESTPTSDLDLIADRMNLLKDTIKPDRNDLDMVYETMLKMGIPLDYSVTEVSVNDKSLLNRR